MNDERKNQTRKMPIQRDGVAYIPGGHRIPPEAEQGETKKFNFVDAKTTESELVPNPVPTGPKVAPKKRVAPVKSTNYSIIMIAAVAVLGLAAVFVFATMFTSFLDSTADAGPGSVVTGDVGGGLLQGSGSGSGSGGDYYSEGAAPPPVAQGSVRAVGLIRSIGGNHLDVYLFDEDRVHRYFIEPHSTLRDRVGSPATLPQFAVGEVVYIDHAPTSNTAETAQLSARVRRFVDITGITIENNEHLIVGNYRFQLGDDPIILYNNQPITIADLDPIDLVTVRVFENSFVASIEVGRSHADVNIPANEEIVNGTVAVGTTVFATLDEGGMQVRVPTGQNRVIINGENIEPFTFDVTVSRGDIANINFDGLAFRAGSLTINTNTEEAILHIGDRWHPVNEPISLDFGEHELRLEAVGHHPAYQTVTIGAEAQEITINLEVIARTRNVIITTSPSEVRIYLDDVFRGVTPLSTELELGRYSLTLERQGFLPTTTTIHLTEDGNTVFSYILAPDPAWTIFN
ncbi:MAG: PEGA domain-containing protein [Defluviitaleaceae bacterium]|nr:PEGA domain-containing protein [Defluviitaleaceae bacterium]